MTGISATGIGKVLIGTLCASALTAAAGAAVAQDFPNRAVRLVLPFATGGSTDAIARMVGQKMSESLGQPVVVENRPGAAGAIASQQVAGAPADGYTILMATTSTHSILPVVNSKLAYDAVKDFAPIGTVARAPNLLIVGPALGVDRVADLIAKARANPGTLSFASSGSGTITHLVAELFKSSAGIDAVHVPYKTGVQALPDLISGQIAFQFDSIVWTLPQVRSGKIKGLAVTGRERSALAPELPTIAESGLPGFEGVTWFAFVAPAATPPAIIARLNRELNKALASTDLREKLAAQGAEPAPGTPEELAQLMGDDTIKWGKVIKAAGVKVE
jgi:tripartite-type tricarboxylate transporter receptor subunit TctC